MFSKRTILKLALYTIFIVVIIVFVKVVVINENKGQNEEIGDYPTIETSQPIDEPQVTYEISVFNHDTEEVLNLDIEDYVIGVVSKEMPASFSIESLKAQAVAARTLAYKYINNKQGCNNCDICTSPAHVQGYASEEDRKLNWGDEYSKWQKIIEDAVMDTAGEVMTFDGDLIDVLYHASSNGRTEDSINVFGGPRQYLVSVTSPDVNLVSDEVIIAVSDFANKVNKAYPDANLTSYDLKSQIRIISFTPSGRVATIALGDCTIDGVSFRQLFSIKSTDFSFAFMNDSVIISTLGYGHGVGMSQRGANEMGKCGYSYVDILTHYYTGVIVTNISK